MRTTTALALTLLCGCQAQNGSNGPPPTSAPQPPATAATAPSPEPATSTPANTPADTPAPQPVAVQPSSAPDGVAWGQPQAGLACGLKLSKDSYKVGEIIEGTLYLKNVSDKPQKVHKLARFANYNFAIKGPPGGDYTWKGPRYTLKPPGPPDVELAPGQSISAAVTPSGQIEQRFDPKGGGMDASSVLPGKYGLWVNCQVHTISTLRTPEVTLQVAR